VWWCDPQDGEGKRDGPDALPGALDAVVYETVRMAVLGGVVPVMV
jgi:hypothetical protein